MSTAENALREDLSVFETIEDTVDLVDAELSGDNEYVAMGAEPVDRVKALLGKLDAVRRSDQRGSDISDHAIKLSRRFTGQLEIGMTTKSVWM